MNSGARNAKSCGCSVGSMTYALKAQRILADAAIPTRVVKMDSSGARKGCAYGLQYSCNQERNVAVILQNARIGFTPISIGYASDSDRSIDADLKGRIL